MSLVAYAGSDESDEEEQVDEAVPSTSKSDPLLGDISDEEDHFAGVSSSTGGTAYSSIFSETDPDTGEINQSEKVNSTSIASLEDLPAPKKKQTIDDSMGQETELESEVLPKAAELAAAPKPPKKQRQPAKITIPSLSNDDEEKDDDERKRPKASNKPSGLFSLLPAPIHSSRKEINRPLIPHTLTKKPVAAKKDTQVKEISSSQNSSSSGLGGKSSQSTKDSGSSVKQRTTFNALTGYDSDSDDDNDDVQGSTPNFFSLGHPSQSSSKKEDQMAAIDSTVETSEKEVGVNNPKDSAVDAVQEARVELGAVNDAPLDFGSANKLHSWTSSSYSNLLPVGPSGPVGSSSLPKAYPESYATAAGNTHSDMIYSGPTDEDESMNAYSGPVPSEDLKQFMSDKEFHIFQGKRKRGLEEEINFVDARVDDYVDPSEVTKHMTEETEYVSVKKDKDNMPTSQQKRKKQITYLAYQAKEKEFELKNAWAQSRQTKKQTQSKYGF